ncbi:hypothetical protein SSYRP_v1c04820 [Spiroplasma syrphidicola EA-1]|uniref:Uncharacterized protein n=1 Tax=Spiroplasma syrphidicola EA-1 TaxID=1276229 RepID=R4UDV1_9MOLU|nr:hypothetical protein [Spiroplasma syrphidicola]AGM26074.1 hypothetical protein SSYRP_v1c04820 [Spiroplasma syrphidicola EA-1]
MSYIEELLSMTYDECVDSLLKKYGSVPKDYFLDADCIKKTPGITRGKEGLYIHHIDEDKAILLSTPDHARLNSFDYQKADRLVYCNLLEHLVLHIKIVEYPNVEQNYGQICGIGGITNFIVPELNDIYSGIVYKQEWKKKVIEVVLPYKADYLKCIKKIVDMNIHVPLLSSFIFNEKAGIWSKDKNEELFRELKKIGVKY